MNTSAQLINAIEETENLLLSNLNDVPLKITSFKLSISNSAFAIKLVASSFKF